MIQVLEPIEKGFTEVSATLEIDPPQKIFNLFRKNYGLKFNVKFEPIPAEILQLRSTCIDLASHLEDDLRTFLSRELKNDETIQKILFSEEEEPSDESIDSYVLGCDFMSKRNDLSKILKKDKRFGGKSPNTKLMHKFIIERNKYAHGKFGILRPEDTLMIQYLKSGKKVNSIVEKRHFDSFISSYYILNKWLKNIKKEPV